MKNLILFTLLSLIAAAKFISCSSPVAVDKDVPRSSAPCNDALWARTYGAMKRFGVLKRNAASVYDRENLRHRCVVDVKATVMRVAEQPDGDVKIWLDLDESQPTAAVPPRVPLPWAEFYESRMTAKEDRWVVAEVVCAAKPKLRKQGRDPVRGDYLYPNEWSPATDPFCGECVEACRGYTNAVYIPKNPASRAAAKEVVYVTGELISDTGAEIVPGTNPPQYKVGHGHMEIHPVTEIKR